MSSRHSWRAAKPLQLELILLYSVLGCSSSETPSQMSNTANVASNSAGMGSNQTAGASSGSGGNANTMGSAALTSGGAASSGPASTTGSLPTTGIGAASGMGNTGGAMATSDTTMTSASAGGATATGAGGTSSNIDECAGADLLCENFESTEDGAVPSEWDYNWGADATSISVQSSESLSGTRALKVENSAGSSGANQVIMGASSFGTTHWGRVYYRVERVGTMTSSDQGAVAHSTFVSFSDGESEFRVVDTVMNQQQDHQFLYNIQPSGDGEWGCGSSYDYTYAADWQCVEWYLSSSEQSYRFFYEGTELDSIAVSGGSTDDCGMPNRSIPTDLGELHLGIYTYQEVSQGFVIWFDDLALGHERIGCGAPRSISR